MWLSICDLYGKHVRYPRQIVLAFQKVIDERWYEENQKIFFFLPGKYGSAGFEDTIGHDIVILRAELFSPEIDHIEEIKSLALSKHGVIEAKEGLVEPIKDLFTVNHLKSMGLDEIIIMYPPESAGGEKYISVIFPFKNRVNLMADHLPLSKYLNLRDGKKRGFAFMSKKD